MLGYRLETGTVWTAPEPPHDPRSQVAWWDVHPAAPEAFSGVHHPAYIVWDWAEQTISIYSGPLVVDSEIVVPSRLRRCDPADSPDPSAVHSYRLEIMRSINFIANEADHQRVLSYLVDQPWAFEDEDPAPTPTPNYSRESGPSAAVMWAIVIAILLFGCWWMTTGGSFQAGSMGVR